MDLIIHSIIQLWRLSNQTHNAQTATAGLPNRSHLNIILGIAEDPRMTLKDPTTAEDTAVNPLLSIRSSTCAFVTESSNSFLPDDDRRREMGPKWMGEYHTPSYLMLLTMDILMET